jgi:hypothetical protein
MADISSRTVKQVLYYYGDSTDTKPLNLPAGSKYKESDTGKLYLMTDDGWIDAGLEDEGDMSDVNFLGKVRVDGKRGENVNIVIPNVGTLKFKEGIMHKFEPEEEE